MQIIQFSATLQTVASGSTYHAVTQNYQSRVTAASGTVTTAELNAIDTMIRNWETNGLIETGLTTGQVSSASIVQFCLPCCGGNEAAAKVMLLHRGTATASQIGAGAQYNTTNKAWSVSSLGTISANTPANNLDLGYIYNSFSPSAAEGSILVRTNTVDRRLGIGALDSGRAFIHPNYSGTVYGDLYSFTSGRLSSTLTASTSQTCILRNTVGSAPSLWFNNAQRSTSASTATGYPTASVKLIAYVELSTDGQQPVTFMCGSVKGVPSAKISGFISSIETFRTALGAL